MKLCVGVWWTNLLLIFIPVCSAARGRYAQKLFKDLFVNYTSALRPVENTEHAINVTLQVTLSQIIDMDERNQILTLYLWVRQVWMDSFLTWSKDDYDGLDTIRIPSRYVWKPDIVLYNSADEEFSSSMETNVVLRSDGQVMWDQPSITKSSCSVDVLYFPFDLQQCVLTFGSWTHNGNQMDLHIELESADLADLVPNVEWQVLGMPAKKNVILYGCCSDPYPDITFTLKLKRRASFYIFNLLLPCMMISFLAPLGFYLPADSGEKVSLGVTVLLALTVFQLLVAESMPPSESVPLIGKYYIATMTMVTASTALTIFIMNLHHCGPEARPVPDWVRVLVLRYLNRLCLVYELGETCTRESPTQDQDSPTTDQDASYSQEVHRKQVAQSWEVNGDHHTATFTADENARTRLRRDDLSVTVESPENDRPVTVRRVENLTQAKTENLRETRTPHQHQPQRFTDNGEKTGRVRLGREMSKENGSKMASVTNLAVEGDTGTDERITHGETKEEHGGEECLAGGKQVESQSKQEFQDGRGVVALQKEQSEGRKESFKASSGPDVENLMLNGEIIGKRLACSHSDEKKFGAAENSPDDGDSLRRSRCGHCCCCCCRRHFEAGPGGSGGRFHGDEGGLCGNVASIAASFQEQRAAQALMGDWRRVAKVMDRALMWIFFIMVFIMSVLILGKSI